MKTYLLLFSVIIVVLNSCNNENKNDSPYVYTNSVIAGNLPPVMGGCIDTSGSLLTFNLPLLEDAGYQSNILVSAKILKIDKYENITPVFDFMDNTFSNGAWTSDTFANNNAWIPEGVQVNLVEDKKGKIYVSCNINSSISVIQNNTNIYIQTIDAVTSITSNGKKGIYAISAPSYTGDYPYTLLNPPTIYEIDSFENKSEFFVFPRNLIYSNNCGYEGSINNMYPIDILIDMTTDMKGNIYVCFGYDNVIYKIDKNKELTTFLDNIHCPVSLAFDRSNNLYVVSAPEFAKNDQNIFEMTKPVEVFVKSKSDQKLIYQGKLKNYGGCLLDSKNSGVYSISGANYNISVTQYYDIFLEDPLEGQVILIK
jgi:hypothetical protein